MPENPYTPPEAEINPPPLGPTRPVRGIVFALAFDFIGTIIASIVLFILYGLVLAGQGLTESEITSILGSEDLFTIWGFIQIAVGLGFSFYSGIICIRVSRGRDLLYPGILAAIGALLAVILYFSSEDIGTLLVLTLMSAVAVLFGAKTALTDQTDAA